jgi:hypothetical protein
MILPIQERREFAGIDPSLHEPGSYIRMSKLSERAIVISEELSISWPRLWQVRTLSSRPIFSEDKERDSLLKKLCLLGPISCFEGSLPCLLNEPILTEGR